MDEYYAKQNKSDGKRQEPYDFIHMWDIKQKATNEQVKQQNKLIDIEDRMVVTKGEQGWGGGRRG